MMLGVPFEADDAEDAEEAADGAESAAPAPASAPPAATIISVSRVIDESSLKIRRNRRKIERDTAYQEVENLRKEYDKKIYMLEKVDEVIAQLAFRLQCNFEMNEAADLRALQIMTSLKSFCFK
jgi:hypothetical protein